MVYRKSKQKDAIIKVLRATNAHPDAKWIYERVKKEIPRISLGTVYRNLKLLKEVGLIQEVGLSGGMVRFDGNLKLHSHFVCDYCGQIVDVIDLVGRSVEERVTLETGCKVTHHRLELGGLCPKCRRLENLPKHSDA